MEEKNSPAKNITEQILVPEKTIVEAAHKADLLDVIKDIMTKGITIEIGETEE